MVSCSSTIESLVKQVDVSRGHCMLSLLHFTAETLIPNIRYYCIAAVCFSLILVIFTSTEELGRVAPTSFNFEPGSNLNLNLVQA